MSPLEQVARTSMGILERFREGIGFGLTEPEYDVVRTPHGLLLSLRGIDLIGSSVLDRSYFKEGPHSLTDPQLEVVGKFENSLQQDSRGKERVYSGLPQYTHNDSVLENFFAIAKKAGVPVSYVDVLTLIGHDSIEDDKRIRTLLKEWEGALHSRQGSKIISLENKLKEERLLVRNEINEQLNSVIPGYLNEREREDMQAVHAIAANNMHDLTRSTDRVTYPVSMGLIYKRKKGEHIYQTLARMPRKSSDRIANQEEVGPRPDGIMEQLRLAFQDRREYSGLIVTDELSNRYGANLKLQGQEMPASVKVQTAFNSLFPLHYQNRFLNRYSTKLSTGHYGPKGADLLRLVIASKEDLIESTVNLLESAISQYEEDPKIAVMREQVSHDIQLARESGFYDNANLGGPLQYWMENDARGRKYVAEMDSSWEDKATNYATARHLREQFPRFGTMTQKGAKSINFELKGAENVVNLMPSAGSYKLPPYTTKRGFDRFKSKIVMF